VEAWERKPAKGRGLQPKDILPPAELPSPYGGVFWFYSSKLPLCSCQGCWFPSAAVHTKQQGRGAELFVCFCCCSLPGSWEETPPRTFPLFSVAVEHLFLCCRVMILIKTNIFVQKSYIHLVCI
jgi:hypothetical protein